MLYYAKLYDNDQAKNTNRLINSEAIKNFDFSINVGVCICISHTSVWQDECERMP